MRHVAFFPQNVCAMSLICQKKRDILHQKTRRKTAFSHTKTGKMTSFFPKKAQKSDLSGSRVVYPCCFLLRVCGLQQSHTLKSARGMMFSASKVYYYNKNHCCPINSINYKNVSLDHCVSVVESYFVIPSPLKR